MSPNTAASLKSFTARLRLSIHEEATFSVNIPAMGIFNNLVLYDQHKPQNSIDTIVPELATSWAWSKDQRELTFNLRSGVKWHDDVPFTAKDVKCTFDLLQGKGQDKFRKNPRKDWYADVRGVTVDGDNEVTFHLNRPQPSLLAMLASGYTPIYPCHVPAAQMRTNPIGTGPFRFVEMKQNDSIKLVKDYWKKGLRSGSWVKPAAARPPSVAQYCDSSNPHPVGSKSQARTSRIWTRRRCVLTDGKCRSSSRTHSRRSIRACRPATSSLSHWTCTAWRAVRK